MSGLPLISVIDDDYSVRESLESLVRSFGFAVEIFSSAEALLNSDHLGDMRCLVLDVRLPGMNGLELQSQLAATDSGIPGIFMTAHGDEAARAQALRNGAVDCLLKPFSEDSVLNAIKTALDKQV